MKNLQWVFAVLRAWEENSLSANAGLGNYQLKVLAIEFGYISIRMCVNYAVNEGKEVPGNCSARNILGKHTGGLGI